MFEDCDVEYLVPPENIKIREDEVVLRWRDSDRFDALKAKIIASGGACQPIVVNRFWEVVFGPERVLAYRELGYEYVPVLMTKHPASQALSK